MIMESKLSDPDIVDGIRVMVVDDDLTYLHRLQRELQQSNYEVQTFGEANPALSFLRQSEGGFDLLLVEACMHGMDGFQLLQQVKKEFNIPVLLMSALSERQLMIRGLKLGACFYLVKPVNEKEIKNIWQYVVKQRTYEIREKKSSKDIAQEALEIISGVKRKAEEETNTNVLVHEENLKQSLEIVDKNEEEDDEDKEENNIEKQKKARIVWTDELHAQFERVVHQLGVDKAVPKRILEMMDRPDLSRENIASHLQKYRILLRKKEQTKLSINGIGQSNYWPFSMATGMGRQKDPMFNESGKTYAYRGQPTAMELQEVLHGSTRPFEAPRTNPSLNSLLLSVQQAKSSNISGGLITHRHPMHNRSMLNHIPTNNSVFHLSQCYMNQRNIANVKLEASSSLLPNENMEVAFSGGCRTSNARGNGDLSRTTNAGIFQSSSSTPVLQNDASECQALSAGKIGTSLVTNSTAEGKSTCQQTRSHNIAPEILSNQLSKFHGTRFLGGPSMPSSCRHQNVQALGNSVTLSMLNSRNETGSLRAEDEGSASVLQPQGVSNSLAPGNPKSVGILDSEGKNHFPSTHDMEFLGMEGSQESRNSSNAGLGSFSMTSVQHSNNFSSIWNLGSFSMLESQTNNPTSIKNLGVFGVLNSQVNDSSFATTNQANVLTLNALSSQFLKTLGNVDTSPMASKLVSLGGIDQEQQTANRARDHCDNMQFRVTQGQLGLPLTASTDSMLVLPTDEETNNPSNECNSLNYEANQEEVAPSSARDHVDGPSCGFGIGFHGATNVNQDHQMPSKDYMLQQNDFEYSKLLDEEDESLSDIIQYLDVDNLEDVQFNQDINDHSTLEVAYDLLEHSMDGNNKQQ